MAIIKAFKGIRARKEYAHLVASKPYDVLSSAEARIEARDNPYSFLHIIKSEIDLPQEVDVYDKMVYEKAKSNFQQMLDDGVLFQDEQDNLYVYRQRMGEYEQTGLMACSSVDDYENDIVKKHEFTTEAKEKDRVNHISITDINSGPVFLTYPDVAEIDKVIDSITEKDPTYDFSSKDGVAHTFWVVEDKDTIAELTRLFADKVPCTYIADGHHRAASSFKVMQQRRKEHAEANGDAHYNFFLSCLFPANQVNILPYNRVITDLNGLEKERFLEKLEKHFEVTPETGNSGSIKTLHQIGMYMDGEWYDLNAKKGSYDESDPVGVLDVSILHDKILDLILGIKDVRRDDRVQFVGGVRGREELERRVDSGEMKLAFDLYPVTIQQLIDIADSDNVMPPKSTWFEPKLRSGLVVHKLS